MEEQNRKKREIFLRKAQEEEAEARKAENFVAILEAKEKEWFDKLKQTQKVGVTVL